MREIQLDFEGFKHWFCYQIEMYNEEWRANGGDAKNHFPFTDRAVKPLNSFMGI